MAGLDPDAQQRLHEALRLSTRPARQLMVPRRFITAINVETTAAELLQQVVNGPYTRFSVNHGSLENIVGILHAKDLVSRYMKRGMTISIEQLMRPVLYLPENVTAFRLLTLMRDGRSHQALVIDR